MQKLYKKRKTIWSKNWMLYITNIRCKKMIFHLTKPGVGNTVPASIFLFLMGWGPQKVLLWPASILIWHTKNLIISWFFWLKFCYLNYSIFFPLYKILYYLYRLNLKRDILHLCFFFHSFYSCFYKPKVSVEILFILLGLFLDFASYFY